MSPNEIKILGAVEEQGRVSKQKAAEVIGVSSDYSGCLLERLNHGGYLRMEARGIYRLTPKGADALISQLVYAESHIRSEMERLSIDRERLAKQIQRLTASREALEGGRRAVEKEVEAF